MNGFFEILLSTIPITNPIWDNLISYYRLDETSGTLATDSKGTNNGTASNITWVSGKNNNGSSFNTTNSYINMSSSSIFNFNRTDTFSVSLWLKRLHTNAAAPFIFSKSLVGGNWTGYGAYFDGSKIDFSIMADTTHWAHVLTTSTFMLTTSYYHLVFTYNGSGNASGLLVYSNGVVQSTTKPHDTFSSGNSTSTATFSIGNRNASLAADAIIDEFAIFNTTLTQTQITSIYNSGSGLFY